MESEIPKTVKAFNAAYNRILDAIKRGDNTGWHAEID
jgi:hypothetical protein